MARTDIPIWTIIGIFVGMVTSAIVNPNYTLIGAILGGLLGYVLGRFA